MPQQATKFCYKKSAIAPDEKTKKARELTKSWKQAKSFADENNAITHDEKPHSFLGITTQILSFRKLLVIESSQRKAKLKEKEKLKAKAKANNFIASSFWLSKPILETSELQKTIYAKRRTVCVSGLAKHKTDIANGRY